MTQFAARFIEAMIASVEMYTIERQFLHAGTEESLKQLEVILRWRIEFLQHAIRLAKIRLSRYRAIISTVDSPHLTGNG